MSLQLLGDNLREIYIAAHTCESGEPPLVANFAGTKIYCATIGWGRLWKWIFDILNLLIGGDMSQKKLAEAISKTKEIFLARLPQLQEHIQKYCSYIQKKSLGISIDEQEYHLSRKEITSWNNGFTSFLIKCSDIKHKQFVSLAKSIIPETLSTISMQSLFLLSPLQQMIDLEGFLHAPIPLELFKKLAYEEKLFDKEEKKLIEWISEQNKKKSPLSVRPFHQALSALVKQLSPMIPGKTPKIANLELALYERGMAVFSENDPFHLSWRSQLKAGDSLIEQPHCIVLGEQIENQNAEEDHNLVFTVKDDPDKVVIVGINEAVLGMKQRVAEQDNWGLPAAQCLYISDIGNFAIYERLGNSIENHPWKSNDTWIDYTDLDILTPIANMLKWMLAQDISPHRLEPKYIRFDSQGVLKYSKASVPKDFDYTEMEEFVLKCSNGTRKIFSYLMLHSGLHAHPYKKYFEKMMAAAIQDKEINGSTTAANELISDPKVVEKGESLYSEICEMKQSCLREILDIYVVLNVEEIQQAIANAILYFYQEMKLSGTLWPTMEGDVIHSVATQAGLEYRI